MMPLEHFLQLPLAEVAERVRDSGTKVVVFPFNGTRRWFLLEHGLENQRQLADAYVEETTRGYIRLYRMLFEHGIETVLAPVFGTDTLERGEEYMVAIGENMQYLAHHPGFLSFYEEYDVRVRFYGEYRKEFQKSYPQIIQSFDQVTQQTSEHGRHRLLYGVFASEATESIAELSIRHYTAHQRTPTRGELIRLYYGEPLAKADLFIGFERFTAFDYPMLSTGEESLYFTVAPSLYMTQALLRKILYDHIYLRPVPEPDYRKMSREELAAMRKAYRDGDEEAFGLGVVEDGIWYAKPR